MKLLLLLVNCALLFLISCAGPKAITNPKVRLDKIVSIATRDSVALVYDVQSLDPRQSGEGRLEVFILGMHQCKWTLRGPLNKLVAEFLWNSDSTWHLSLPMMEKKIVGQGDKVILPLIQGNSISISVLTWLLAGEAPPSADCFSNEEPICRDAQQNFFYERDSLMRVHKAVGPNGFEYLANSYGAWEDNLFVPSQIVLKQFGKSVVKLSLTHLTTKSKWRKNPFVID